MEILSTLQRSVEGLHDVSTELDVRAYLVDDELRQEIPGFLPSSPEQLFVREDAEGVELALYVCPKVLEGLHGDDPHARLHEGNLEPYCIALEGVSHFVLVAHRAEVGRPVSALELELQAEVDKFVSAWLLLAEQGGSLAQSAKMLTRKLFDEYSLRQGLGAEEAERYHTASRAAKKFCTALATKYAGRATRRRLEAEVRGYVRRGLGEKLRAA